MWATRSLMVGPLRFVTRRVMQKKCQLDLDLIGNMSIQIRTFKLTGLGERWYNTKHAQTSRYQQTIVSLSYTLCLQGNLQCFLSSADIFSKSTFSKISFRNTTKVSKSLDPDQARRVVGPDLGPNCLQRLSVGDTSSQRVKYVWN